MALIQKIASSAVLVLIVFAISCQCSPTNSSRKGVPPASLNPSRVSTNLPSVRVNSTAVHRTQRSPNADLNDVKSKNRTAHSAEESNEETPSGGKIQHFQIFQRPVPAGDSGETIRVGSNPSRNSTHGAGVGGANGNRPHVLIGSGAVVN